MNEESAGLPVVGQDGQHYRFNPGALCLELIVSGGEGERAHSEVLHELEDLKEWLPHTRFGPARISMSRAALAQLKLLRESIYRCAERAARGETLDPADFQDWNRLAAQPPPVPELSQEQEWGYREPVPGSAVLSAFARDAIELFGGPYRDRVRACAGPDCGLLFVDTSRPGRRRWCSMQRCGNRAKQRIRQEAGRGHA